MFCIVEVAHEIETHDGGEILKICSVVVCVIRRVHRLVEAAAHVFEVRGGGQHAWVRQLGVTVRHKGLAVVESCLGTREKV